MTRRTEIAAETEDDAYSKEAAAARQENIPVADMPPPRRKPNDHALLLSMILVAGAVNISVYNAAVLQAASNSTSRDFVRKFLKAALDRIDLDRGLSLEEKKAKSLEMIQVFLRDNRGWAYIDLYRDKETVAISLNEFTPGLILLALRLSENKPLYLDEFLSEDEDILLEDLVKLGLYLELEIGLHVEESTNRIVLNHGVAGSGSTRAAGVSRPEPRNCFRMFAHTHPTDSREVIPQFSADLGKDTPGLELVITAGKVIVYFDRHVIYNKTERNHRSVKLVLDSLPDDLRSDISIRHPVNSEFITKLLRLQADIAERAPEETKIAMSEDGFGSLFDDDCSTTPGISDPG